MANYLTLPFSKKVLISRVAAMTAKASEMSEAQTSERQSVIQRATGSPEDTMLLASALRSALDSFFVFIAGEAFGIQHIKDTLSDESDDFLIEMERPPRFNEAMRQPLVSQVSDFIVRSMLFQWYSAFSSEAASQQSQLLPQIQFNIARCFRKVDASPLTGLFPTKVHINRASIPEIVSVGDRFSLYFDVKGVSPNILSDISLDLDPQTRRKVYCDLFSDHIEVRAISDGIVSLLLYSEHDDSVNDVVTFMILPYA